MHLTDRQLNRATLARQLLLEREQLDAVGAIRRILAVQAQSPPSPYLALWARLDGFDASHLDAAFADQKVVKASLMRITLHAVHADDYPAMYAAMAPSLRGARLHDRRFLDAGLTKEDAETLLPQFLAFLDQPRSAAEVEAHVAELRGQPEPWLWWAYRTFAPMFRAPTGGPWTFDGSTAYVASGAPPTPEDRDAGVQWLVRRYLEAFGPATVPDIGQFNLMRRPVIKEALHALGDEVTQLEVAEGPPLFDVADGVVPDEDVPAPPRLLPMWDSTLLAYADRSRVIPPEYRPTVIRRNGDVLPTLLVDGYVAGVWRPVADGIEATAFHALDDEAWEGLEAEAQALLGFLADRDPTVYSRYNHWWDKGLPSEDVRLLGP